MSKIIITTMLAFVAMTGQASWCIPCRREIPNLIAAYNKPPTAPSLPTDFVERTLKRNLQKSLNKQEKHQFFFFPT